MIQTIQKFEKIDLDAIIGMPIIELCDDFKTFQTSNLDFSVEKRTMIITGYTEITGKKPNQVKTEKYFFTQIHETVKNNSKYQIFTADELIEKLNNSKRQYRLATPEECRYIAMKRFDWLKEMPVFESMK